MSVVYSARKNGGYYFRPDGNVRAGTVSESAPWMRTSGYFRWTAKLSGKIGYGPTRKAAVSDVIYLVERGDK